MTRAEPVVRGVSERVAEAGGAAALDGLAAAGALHGRGIDQQKIVIETGAVPGELADHRLDRSRQTQPALVKRGPLRQAREQVPEPGGGRPAET